MCINFTDTVFILNYECYGSTKFCAYTGKSQNCKPCLLSYPIPWESQFSFTSEQKKNVLLKCNSEVIKTASGAAGSQHLRCILWDTGATLIFVCVWCPSHVQISITSTLICLVWGCPFPWVCTCYYSFLLFKTLLTQGFPFTNFTWQLFVARGTRSWYSWKDVKTISFYEVERKKHNF